MYKDVFIRINIRIYTNLSIHIYLYTSYFTGAFDVMTPDGKGHVENQRKQQSQVFLRFRYLAASLVDNIYEDDYSARGADAAIIPIVCV